MSDGRMSREMAAGYEVATLGNAVVLLVGTGALGQSLAQILALSQVGELRLVDFDEFEESNATRSPFFPTAAERDAWGNQKAQIVAHKLRQLVSWSDFPRLRYACERIQAVGDAPFREASVVISAVDHDGARNYINNLCRRHAVPLVEGGFAGLKVNMTVLRNSPDGPCWRCSHPDEIEEEVSFDHSCTSRARDSEASGFIPATQSAASVLAGIMAEAAIQVLHKNDEVFDRKVYLNARTGYSVLAGLDAYLYCETDHVPLSEQPITLETTCDQTASDLLREVSGLCDSPVIDLPRRFVRRMHCEICESPLVIEKPIWAISSQPRCTNDGGIWERELNGETGLDVSTVLAAELTNLHNYTCRQLGIPSGAVLTVWDRNESGTSVQMAESDQLFHDVFFSVNVATAASRTT